jgi:hypothetical protein
MAFLDNGESQAGENLGFEKVALLGLGCVETLKMCRRKTVGMVCGVSDPFRICDLQSRDVRMRQCLTTARLSESHTAPAEPGSRDGVDLGADRSRFGETAKNLRTCPRKAEGMAPGARSAETISFESAFRASRRLIRAHTRAQQGRSCKRRRPSDAISFRCWNHRTGAGRHPRGPA